MISIREQDYGLNVALYNEFTLEDFHQFEEAALQAVKRVHRPDVLLDLSMLKDLVAITVSTFAASEAPTIRAPEPAFKFED